MAPPVCMGCRRRPRAIAIWEKPATGLCFFCGREWLRSPEKAQILADLRDGAIPDESPEYLVDVFLRRMYQQSRWWNRLSQAVTARIFR